MAPSTVNDPTVRTMMHVTVQVAPDNAELFLQILRTIHLHVTAEPELTFSDVYQSFDTPGLFKITEAWNATREWLYDVQLKKDYYKPYVEQTAKLWIKPREIDVWERIPGWALLRPDYMEKPLPRKNEI